MEGQQLLAGQALLLGGQHNVKILRGLAQQPRRDDDLSDQLSLEISARWLGQGAVPRGLTSKAHALDLDQYMAREGGPLCSLVDGDAQIALELQQTFLRAGNLIRLAVTAGTR